MLATDAGGLAGALPSGTRSLLLVFGPVQIGAVIETDDGREIEPGNSYDVRLLFWADEAAASLPDGAEFVAWHGRDVGSGRLVDRDERAQ